MALLSGLMSLRNVFVKPRFDSYDIARTIHTTIVCEKNQSARYKKFAPGKKPRFTYEMLNPPHRIAHRKAWTAWNTTTLLGGRRSQLTAIEDMFIRKFMTGVMHNIFDSEILIKRQHNMIRIGGVITDRIIPRKVYFLIGFCEEMLTYWLQCPVKLELQACKTGVI